MPLMPSEPPVDPDGVAYEFVCVLALGCAVLDDRHGAECVKANDDARHEFYVEAIAAPFARVIL